MSAKKKTAARKISRKPVAKKQELREDIEIGCLDLPDGELAVRVVDGKNGQRIDVRKFIATDTYEGPTKQGFRITWEQAQELAEFLAEAVMNVEDTAE